MTLYCRCSCHLHAPQLLRHDVMHNIRVEHCLRSPLISNYFIFKSTGTSFALLGSPSAVNGDSSIGQQQCGQSKKKRSWSRAVFSNLQRKGLEKRFEVQKYVTKPDRRQLAAMLGLTDAQVCSLNTEGHSFKTLRFFQVIRLYVYMFSPFYIYAYDLKNFFYF